MFSLYFTALKKSCSQRNQSLFTNLGANTGTSSYNNILIFRHFWKFNWKTNRGSRRVFLHGIYCPWLIMMSVITSSYANVSSSFFSQKFQKNIEELLVAPVPTHVIIWGFVIGGMGRSILVGALVTLISLFFVPLHVFSWTIIIITLLMTSILFSLAGLLNGIFAQSYDDVSIVPTFVLQPLTYLGGVFYAISMLPPFWQVVSKINPIVYMISGFRYGFLGTTDMSTVVSMLILVLFIAVLYSLCWYLISKGRGLRS